MPVPNLVDIHVGSRVRRRRSAVGMSQWESGETLGLSHQQIQKYESGATRIGSRRLFQLGQVLRVPVSFFFEEMCWEGAGVGDRSGDASRMQRHTDYSSPRESQELLSNYGRIRDESVRKHVLSLVKALARP